jgi:hypothetical protein
LVDLYQKSLEDTRKVKGSYEAQFNDKSHEATTLGKILEEVEMPNLTIVDNMDMKNKIIEYNFE